MSTHVFLSYAHDDADEVFDLINYMKAQNIEIWVDHHELLPGTLDWEQSIRNAIEQAYGVILIATPSSRRSPYVRDELAIADMSKKPIYPLWLRGKEWIEAIPLGRGSIQFIDARGERFKEGVEKIRNILNAPLNYIDPSIKSTHDRSLKESRNPYKGLKSFQTDDQHDFFGRHDFVHELVTTVEANVNSSNFLCVVGPSGSGKSSVVMAGLLPELNRGTVSNSDKWLYLPPFVPGQHPIENLAIALSHLLPSRSMVSILDDLNDASGKGLHLLAKHILKDKSDKLVVYIDQFEELFTMSIDGHEQAQFIKLFLNAIDAKEGKVFAICTLRADFYDRPLQYPRLGLLVKENSIDILPMSVADLYDVIQQPAKLNDVSIKFEDYLVAELVFSVREQSGALPLLQFTLDQLFEHRDGNTLSWHTYNSLGGIKGALAKHAEHFYADLPSDEHRRLTRDLFLRLLDVGEFDQEITRRRALQRELFVQDEDQSQIFEDIMKQFIDGRLLTASTGLHGHTIEVSHEALLREWDRLAKWISSSRSDIKFQKTLSNDVRRWIEGGQNFEELYFGKKLQDARDWATRNIPNFEEVAFINASYEAEQRKQKEEQKRIEDQRQMQRRIEQAEFVSQSVLANISHEMRTPLNSIIGFSRVMMKGIDGPITDLQEQDLATIYNSGQQVLNLVNDLLDQAKIDNQKLEVRSAYFDLNKVLNGINSVFIQSANEKSLILQVVTDETLPQAYADEFRTRQILNNLVSNAIRYTDKGYVSIRAYNDVSSDMICIDVKDTGVGIDEDQQMHIFEKFVRLNASVNNRQSDDGVGLGLSIAKELAELQGGKIALYSVLGEGSTFSFFLPTKPI